MGKKRGKKWRKNKKTIKIGNDEVSEDLFTKIHGYAVAEFKKQLVEDVVKKEFQCSACKGWPRPGMGSFKKCGTCLKIFCCTGKSEINPDQNCGYHLCNGNSHRTPAMEVLMTFSIQHLPFICKNNKIGCEEILDESKLLEHEKYCNYQKVNCAFLESCKVEVGLLNYMDHIKDTHFLMNAYGQ